jgi:membrane protein YqaA with SNARE-associated domain
LSALGGFFAFFLTWWGAFLLAALDTSLLFFLPFGVDALVVYLAARNRDLFWLYPLLATGGSLLGAGLTFWIGHTAGEAGLKRLVSPRHLERLQKRIRDSGAIAFAIPGLMPPPFPLTPFILTCGALAVNVWRFFVAFTVVRLVRFGFEALLARRYGHGVLRILQSDRFQLIVIAFAIIAVVGTVVSAGLLWRNTRRPGQAHA